MTSGAPSPDALASAARALPLPIVNDAAGGDASYLEDDFQYATAGLYKFGERLIYSAGLVVGALYLGLTEADDANLDHRLLGYFRTLLFNRPYDLGLAISILERLAAAGGRINVRPTVRPEAVSGFLALHRDTPGNTYRARHRRSLEQALWDLLEYVAFLKRLEFGGAQNTARFDGRDIAVWPFLRWTGGTLWTLRETRTAMGRRQDSPLPEHLLFVSHQDYEEKEALEDIGAVERQAVIRVAGRVHQPVPQESQIPAFSSETESFIPLVANSYSRMGKLLDLIIAKAEQKTKRDWVEWYLERGEGERPERTRVDAALLDTTTVENAILAYALEYDPIVLLTRYFESESEDILECIELLEPGKADEILTLIDGRLAKTRARIEPLFTDGDQMLGQLMREHRARLAAVEVAQLLRFNIRSVIVRESIEDYVARVANFFGYVSNHRDAARIDAGLQQCCVICEEVLDFVNLFYRAVEGFDSNTETGLSIAGKSILQQTSQGKRGLGTFIGAFTAICRRYERGLPHLGQRRRLEDDAKPHLDTLKRLNTWRNNCGRVHPDASLFLSIGERLDLLQDVVRFLEWLLKPYPNRGGTFDRIYPAVLQLNVLTTNRCGLTSIKYMLRERSASDAIRLYTQQRVSGIAGVFYGLPVRGKGNAELWVDPVLFAAEAFETAAARVKSQ